MATQHVFGNKDFRDMILTFCPIPEHHDTAEIQKYYRQLSRWFYANRYRTLQPQGANEHLEDNTS